MFNMKRLRELRKSQSITQREVAQYLGVSISTYSGWETGVYQMDYEHLCKTADFFGVTVDELLGRTPQLFDDARVPKTEVQNLFDQLTAHQKELVLERMRAYIDANEERGLYGGGDMPIVRITKKTDSWGDNG